MLTVYIYRELSGVVITINSSFEGGPVDCDGNKAFAGSYNASDARVVKN